MTLKIRDEKQDIVKGLGILTVVDYHTVVTTALTKVLKFGWSSSLMLIFFFLAGMNYTPGKRTLLEDIKRRSIAILRPFIQYIVLTTLVCGSWILIGGLMTPSEIVVSIMKFLVNGLSTDNTTMILICLIPYWFLENFFFASLLFLVCVHYVYKDEKKTWICIVLLSLISAILFALNIDIRLWHIQTVPGFTAIMLLGFVAKQKDLLTKIPDKSLPCILTLIISALLGIILYYYFGGAYDVSQGIWGTIGFWSLPLALIAMVLNLLTYYSLATFIEKVPKLSQLFVWIGQHSLIILLVHFPILCTLGNIFGWDAGASIQAFSWSVYFRDVILLLLTILFSLIWCRITDWYKKENHIMLKF